MKSIQVKTSVGWGWVSAPIRVPSMVSLHEGGKKTHHKTHLGGPRCEKTWPQSQLKFFGHWFGFVLGYFCSGLGLKECRHKVRALIYGFGV